MSVTVNSLAQELEEMEDQRDALDAMIARLLTLNEETVPWSLVKRISEGEHPIRVWREYRGLPLVDLALQMGVNEAQLLDFEEGRAEPGLQLAARIARALRVDLDDLVPASQD
jgi:DNA-binding XRE family transcriptional regulator